VVGSLGRDYAYNDMEDFGTFYFAVVRAVPRV
jgi:hypothetical protein